MDTMLQPVKSNRYSTKALDLALSWSYAVFNGTRQKGWDMWGDHLAAQWACGDPEFSLPMGGFQNEPIRPFGWAGFEEDEYELETLWDND